MAEPSVASKTKKKWSKTRKILAFLGWIPAIYFFYFGLSYFVPVKLEISPDTVYLENPPMNEYGTVDYIGWLNEQNSKGVTPDENIVVAIYRIVGARQATVSEQRDEIAELLGIKSLPLDGTFILSEKYQKQHEIKDTRKMNFLLDGEQYLWLPDESIETAAYLKANQSALASAVLASRCKEYYRPIVSKKKTLLDQFTSPSKHIRTISRLLACRSNMLIAQGKLDEAWRDILAIRRIGLLMRTTKSKPIDMIDQLVGTAIRNLADRQVMVLLASDNLTAKQARDFLVQWRQLPFSKVDIEAVMMAPRFMSLDCVMAICDARLERKSELDINAMLRRVNHGYNQAVVMMQNVPLSELEQKLDAIDEKQNDGPMTTLEIIKKVLLSGGMKKMVSEIIGDFMGEIMCPSYGQVLVLYEAEQCSYDLAELGLALRCYEFKHGRYPEKLSQLSPEFLKKIPNDPLADNKPYKYKVTDKGFILYGVGRDFEDNGGFKQPVSQCKWRGTDIVVEVPFVNPEIPKKKERPKRRRRTRRRKAAATQSTISRVQNIKEEK